MKKQRNNELEHVSGYLPMHILKPILEKIPSKQRWELSLVCKNWKELVDEIQANEHLPWLMYFNYFKPIYTCKLFDPSTQTTYKAKKEPKDRKLLDGALILDAKHGWVLLAKSNLKTTLCFLYSPFTGKVIKFPDLPEKGAPWGKIALNSISPYCIVAQPTFGINEVSHCFFKTYHLGDRNWSETFKVRVDYPTNRLVDMVCRDDIVYCLFSNGKVGEFRTKQQTWKWVQNEIVQMGDGNTHSGYRVSISCIDGDIIMLRYSDYCRCPYKSWRLDLESNKWEAVSGKHLFRNKALFLSRYNSLMLVPALGNARAYGGEEYHCYCGFGLVKEPDVFAEDYAFLKDRRNNEYRCWIQPPWLNPLSTVN